MFIPSFKRAQFIILAAVFSVAGPIAMLAIDRYSDSREEIFLSNYICKVAEPRLQVGAIREVEDYLRAAAQNLRTGLEMLILVQEHGRVTKIGNQNLGDGTPVTCMFDQAAGASVEFYFHRAPRPLSDFITCYLVAFIATISIALSISELSKVVQSNLARLFEEQLREKFELQESAPLQSNFWTKIIRLIPSDSSVLERIRKDLIALRRTIAEKEIALIRAERDQTTVDVARQVSHDIRSPLSALRMISGKSSSLPDAERSLIVKSVDRIQAIAADLLNQTRTSASPYEVQASNSSNFVHAYEAVEELFREKQLEFCEQNKVQLSFEGSDPIPTFCRADESILKRVLSNLVNNAVEAISDQGSVRIHFQSTKNEIWISIVDSGRGMSTEQIERLGRDCSTNPDKPNSNGLGVYSARIHIQQWGGKLTYQSKVGAGTIATVRLKIVNDVRKAARSTGYAEKTSS